MGIETAAPGDPKVPTSTPGAVPAPWRGLSREWPFAHVYRVYAADGQLIYIGSTNDLMPRLARHKRKTAFYDRFARVVADDYLPLREARAAEVAAIRSERPLLNRQHNPDCASLSLTEQRERLAVLLNGVPVCDSPDGPEVLHWNHPAHPRMSDRLTA